MKKRTILIGTMLLMFVGMMWMTTGAQAADSTLLNLRKLTTPEKSRLSKKALREYDLGLQSLDKINNLAAFNHFEKAVKLDPNHIHLRFLFVQLAHYMGDTTMGDESVKYYDLATASLKEILKSKKLNKRERTRAEMSLELTQKLRQSVVQRDENRLKYGLELAKLYAKEVYEQEEKPEPVKPGGAPVVVPSEAGKTIKLDTDANSENPETNVE